MKGFNTVHYKNQSFNFFCCVHAPELLNVPLLISLVKCKLPLIGCTQLPAVAGIPRTQPGRSGCWPVAHSASGRSQDLCIDAADRRRHLSQRPAASAVGPGATHPDLSESRGELGANGGPLPLCRAGGPYLGVSWAARWCGGSPERTASVEPAVSRLGSRSRCELPGHLYRVWTASGADSDEAVSLHTSGRHRVRALGTGRQSQSFGEAGGAHGQAASRSRSLPARPLRALHSSCAGRRAGQRSVGSWPFSPARWASVSSLQAEALTGQGRSYADSDAAGPADRRPDSGAGPTRTPPGPASSQVTAWPLHESRPPRSPILRPGPRVSLHFPCISQLATTARFSFKRSRTIYSSATPA
jgi:hypothetical protein